MSFLPPIVIKNPYYLGDTVLLEPIASQISHIYNTDVYIQSAYSDLLNEHPIIKAIDLYTTINDARLLDLKEPIRSIDKNGKILPDKLKNIYLSCGLEPKIIKPILYLNDSENNKVAILREMLSYPRIGICIESRHEIKNYPYMKQLLRLIIKYFGNAYIINKSYVKGILRYGGFPVINKNLRELMIWIKSMDIMIGPDTGPMHIAGALNVPSIVLTHKIWSDLYEPYPNTTIISGLIDSKYALYTIPIKKVLEDTALRLLDNRSINVIGSKKNIIKRRTKDIALFRLDGLGGSITLTDQATKIYNKTGIKSTLVVRNHKDIFNGHPCINDVIEVGYVNWLECLSEIKKEFNTIAEIRFAPAKWHQSGTIYFEQDFSELEKVFDEFPLNYREFESYGMHHVQITDKILGLPYDTIDCELYCFDDIKQFNLPSEYMVINNGVDVQHQGLRQPKLWHRWSELVSQVDMPVVLLGTRYDTDVDGVACDLRGKTTLSQLATIVRDAKIVVCTEGGIMHLAYAVKAPNVLVLRGPTRGKLFEYPGHHFVDSYVCYNCWSSTDDWFIRCAKNANSVCMRTITPERVKYHIGSIL